MVLIDTNPGYSVSLRAFDWSSMHHHPRKLTIHISLLGRKWLESKNLASAIPDHLQKYVVLD
jgi:hypothetical protein